MCKLELKDIHYSASAGTFFQHEKHAELYAAN
jgi:hypothetical protein